MARTDVETAAILLADVTSGLGAGVMAIRRIVPIPDSGYLGRQVDRISIDPVVFNRLVRPARDLGMSVVTIHSHPKSDEAWFSVADDRGDARLMRSLQAQIPCAPHGSMVLSASAKSVARVFDGREAIPAHLNIIGRTIERVVGGSSHEHWFDRHILALGKQGSRQVRSMRVGIVGLGGIGSVINCLACHHGVQQIVCMDGDTVEATNVPRIVGSSVLDVGVPKVNVAARYGERLGLPGKQVSV